MSAPDVDRSRRLLEGAAERNARTPYAELHAHSAFTLLDGADLPGALVAAASDLGLEALAVLDVDGMHSAVQTTSAAREAGLPIVHGAELTLDPAGLLGADPDALAPGWGLATGAEEPGVRLPVLVSSPRGYTALCSAMSAHALARPGVRTAAHVLDELAEAGEDWLILTGSRRGPLRRALRNSGLGAARRVRDLLLDRFGAGSVLVESALSPTDPEDLADALALLADERSLPLVATGAVRCATPASQALGDVLAATRLGEPLAAAESHLPALRAFLRTGEEMAALHSRRPDAVAYTVDIAARAAFDLRLLAPRLPRTAVPADHDDASWLRELTRRGALERYGTRAEHPRAWETIDHELEVIEALDFPGYFLIVKEIVDFCAEAGILCQGRGSAANSAVCYALGITAVDAVRHRLLFERFLSTGRSGPPDIDVDIEAGRREEVIQHVYTLYGRERAAQVANVITYRPRSAIRDAARALGYPVGLATAWAKGTGRRFEADEAEAARREGEAGSAGGEMPPLVRSVAVALQKLPRHMGIHSGGMVLTDQPVAGICPVVWAAKEGRTVLQWDKEDCADAGLVKFDLLGLGMLTALRTAFDALAARGVLGRNGRPLGLHNLPEEDPRVYDLLCAADTVGVFQVESRAQMNTLPRLAPRCFYDIVVEVALIRPGPIQGRAVNPYLRRRRGREEVSYLHPLMRPALEKTLGVPLFQEQLMQIAIDVAGFSPSQADRLRRAMGAKRSPERMEELRPALMEGMAARGVGPEARERIFEQLKGFADFGFPESHAFSFAHIVYASAWLKIHHPEDFYAGLLAAQPMGFYSPASLVHDARRHGVRVLGPDVSHSGVSASVVFPSAKHLGPAPLASAPVPLDVDPSAALRLGLDEVRGLSEAAERIIEARIDGPFESLASLAARAELSESEIVRLAKADALASLGVSRREGVWAAGAVGRASWGQPYLPGTEVGARAPALPEMTEVEALQSDYEATGLSTSRHPFDLLRPELAGRGVLSASEVGEGLDGELVTVAGIVTHRQRPHTAKGITFLTLEDETGLLNVSCQKGMWEAHRLVALSSRALEIRGRVEYGDGAVNIEAYRMRPVALPVGVRSRDFR